MQVLITGITGSGGSYLAEYIITHHKDVKILGITRWHSTTSNKNISKVLNHITTLNCDMCDFGNVYRVIKKHKPDVIFHLASFANVRNSFDNVISTYTNNVLITLNLLETIRILKDEDNYNPIIQICSSSEVYGLVSKQDLPITESHPIQPVNPYASSKLAQDNLGYVYQKSFGLKVIRTRMFAYLNAKRPDLFSSAFARQIIQIKQGKLDILKHGNLCSIRTLLDVRDAMESYWLSIEKGKIGEVYNIGSEIPISVNDFLQKLIIRSGIDIITQEDPNLLRPIDITLQIPDCTKFKIDTGWKPKYSLEESIDFFLQEIKYYM